MFPTISRPSTQFLQKHLWFRQLSNELQADIADRTLELEGNKGDVLLHAGEKAQGWYAVLSGLVKLQSQPCQQGRVSAFIGVPDGEWFGEGSVLKSEPRRYEVIALRDTKLLCLQTTHFSELMTHTMSFNHFLITHMNRRIGQAMAIIEAERVRSPNQRVALYLSRVFWQDRRRLTLSQEELGHLAGLSRQTVNRALKSMEQKGLVSLEFGRVTILDESAIATYAIRPTD
jgi:CRP/FNR family transcriptional regulator, cyclic AMP receptor protein